MANKYDDLMDRLHWVYVTPERNKTVTEQDIHGFERSLGRTLPPDYVEFLKKFGYTTTRDEIGIPDSASIEVFYGLDPKDTSSYSLMGFKKWEGTGLPSDCLPIASSPGGVICLRLSGESIGRVYWFDPHGGSENPFDDAILLAKDFDTFLRKLVIIN